jgi:hypothetical protein
MNLLVFTSSRIFSNRLTLQVVLPEGSKNPEHVVPFVTEKHLEVIPSFLPNINYTPLVCPTFFLEHASVDSQGLQTTMDNY